MFFVPLKQKKLGLFIRFFEIFSLIFLPGSGSETSNSGSRTKFGIQPDPDPQFCYRYGINCEKNVKTFTQKITDLKKLASYCKFLNYSEHQGKMSVKTGFNSNP